MIDTLKTVLWGAIGIRRKSAHEQAKINPVHVIVMGIVLVVLSAMLANWILFVGLGIEQRERER